MSERLAPSQKPRILEPTQPSLEVPIPVLDRNFNEFGAVNPETLGSAVDRTRLAVTGLARAIAEKRLARVEKKVKHLNSSVAIHKEAADIHLPEKSFHGPAEGLEQISLLQKQQSKRAAKRMTKIMRNSDRQFWLQQAWGGNPDFSPLPDDFEKAKKEKKQKDERGETWRAPSNLLQARIDNPKGKNEPYRSPEETQRILQTSWDVGTPEYKARVKQKYRGFANTWRRWGALDAGDRFNKIQKKAAKKHTNVVRSAEGQDIPGKFIGRRIKKLEKRAERLHDALNNLDERQEQRREKVREQKISALDKKADEAVLQAHFRGHVADIMENHVEGHMDTELEMEPQNKKELRAEKRMIKNYRAIHEYRSRAYKGDEAKMHSDIEKYGTDLPLELAGALEGDIARLRKKREKELKRAEKLRDKADSLGESS